MADDVDRPVQLWRSAPSLVAGAALSGIGGAAAGLATSEAVLFIGGALGLVGFISLLLGLHRLATNVDAIMLTVLEREAAERSRDDAASG